MYHRHDSVSFLTLSKGVLHFEGSLTKTCNRNSDIVGLARKKRRQIIGFRVAKRNRVIRVLKVFFPGVASIDNKLLKGVVGKAENVPEKHDFRRIGLPECQGLFGFEDMIHIVSHIKASTPLTASRYLAILTSHEEPPLSRNVIDLKVYDSRDFPAYLPKLNKLYDDLFAGGKGFRAKLIRMMASNLSLDGKSEHLLAQTIEFIHNASLLHDDLIDRSNLRRGKTAAWLKYTPEYAVLAGDYLLARVMVNLSGHGNIKLVQYTAEVISDLLEGEWLQDSVVGDFFVTLEQLDRIHNLKTASLFKWCIRAPFIAQERYDQELHQILEEMGTLLGQLFQRSDDLLDYDIRNDEGKAILGDLKSGYLNSFGAFVCQGRSRQEIDQIVKSKNLEDYYQSIGGKEKFDAKLAEFDKMNEGLIQMYDHHLERLKKHLKPGEERLIEQLRPLTEILYWRRKPS